MKTEFVPQAIERLDDWVNRLAKMLPPPIRHELDGGDFVWRFPEEGVAVLLIAKAVRISAALGASWELAKLGYSTEAATLLRLIDDFAQEIQFMAEAHIEGRETKAQKDFRTQFFDPPARSLDEFLKRERQYFVSRGEISKACRKLAEKTGQDGGLLDRTSSFISHGLNRYTHGAYDTAMELYHGGRKRFMLQGVEGRPMAGNITFVGTKATEALQAVELVGILFGSKEIPVEIRKFLMEADPDLWPDP